MTELRNRIYKTLSTKQYTWVLVGVNVIITAMMIYLQRNDISQDHFTYMYYIKGIEQGRYTYWWNIANYVPDTFRNPGYPFFLYLVSRISDNRWIFVIAQTLLYFVSIYYLLKIIEVLFPREKRVIQNIFLTILAYSIVVPYYISLIFPEIAMLFLIVFTTYYLLTFNNEKWHGYVVLGLLYGIMFQFRPVVLFLPFVIIFYLILINKFKYIYKYILLLFVLIVSLLPYGFWNFKQHGIFSITPLEGGGGVMYLGYWSYKMPGYAETRYWHNVSDRNLISFTKDEDVLNNIKAFNKEWDYIDSSCAKYLTVQDSMNLKIMEGYDGMLFLTYNGRYTYEREKLLKSLAIRHYLDDPLYTFKIKLFSLFRLWFAGLDKNYLLHKSNIAAFNLEVLPFIITFPPFSLFILLLPYAMFKRKINFKEITLLLILMSYFGVLHLPFVLQSRYTIPVRPFMYMLVSVAICRIFFKAEKEHA